MADPSRPPDDLLPLWFAVALLFALLVGAAAGLLAWRGGYRPASAIVAGGYAFGGALTLAILVIRLFRR